MNKIELKNVSKSFRDVRAVDHVSLTFEENKIYGLLGRNGAGKSTLLNLITSRDFPDGGEITVDGSPAIENDDAMSKIYLMSENDFYIDSMRVQEAYKWAGRFYPSFDTENAIALAGKFSLDTNKKMRELSTGYNSIFKLSVALSSGAPYIFLDEPVLGLDANHRELFYRLLLEQYEKSPACYVISTHLIEEAAGIVEDVMILKDGKLLLNESCESLLAKGYTVTGSASAVDSFISGKNCIGQDSLGGLKTAYILEKLQLSSIPEGLEISKLDLQKLFIQLTSTQEETI